MNDNIIDEILKPIDEQVEGSEVVKVSEAEYRIANRIRDLKFVFIINTERLTYRVQCHNIDEFTFINSEDLGRMISNFKVLTTICEGIEVVLKKYK